VGEGKDVLEVGCGTGLVLQRIAAFARSARGIDLSPGMLERARARGLTVDQGSATDLPYEDASFDVACSFKVLAHVPDLDRALREMIRVVRPGGHVVFDAYNRHSLRYLIRRLRGPRPTSARYDEGAIETRFDAPAELLARLPPGVRVHSTAGIRVATLHPALVRLPGVGRLVERVEWGLMDSPLWRFGGFVVFTLERAH